MSQDYVGIDLDRTR